MASEGATTSESVTATALEWWSAGIVGGLVGGLLFGAMMAMEMPMVLEAAIPGMFGLGESMAVGWVIHLGISAFFGLVFAAAVALGGLEAFLDTNLKLSVAGLGYGLLVWIVAAAIVMPIWVNATMNMGAPVPNLEMESALGHAVYGVLLGLVYAVLSPQR